MKHKFTFGDESGNPSDALSTHFVVALLEASERESIVKIVQDFKQFKGFRQDSELKFHSSTDANRSELLNRLVSTDWSARIVVIDKRTATQKDFALYVAAWTQLLHWAKLTIEGTNLILDEYGNPAMTIPALRRSLRKVKVSMPIKAVRSHTEPCLQAVDMVVGASFRLVEHGDTRFYNLIRSRTKIWRPIENENPPS